ncbi:MAG TPA: cupin domain-containing protein [Steroidobacteraceae bacterium]|nr:cupin domain-containing protein [Steroidobacteraceae bacterium]
MKLKGDLVWHDHQETDETFIVIDGELRIDFRDGAVQVSRGEMFVVPKGVEHRGARCSSFRRALSTSPTPKTRSSCC